MISTLDYLPTCRWYSGSQTLSLPWSTYHASLRARPPSAIFILQKLAFVTKISMSTDSPACGIAQQRVELQDDMQSWGRQPTRLLHILDLPNEILGEICAHVRGAPSEPLELGYINYLDGGQEAIKSTRLVCRKFCEASSHLLLTIISVSMTLSSLAHLDKVSRHP